MREHSPISLRIFFRLGLFYKILVGLYQKRKMVYFRMCHNNGSDLLQVFNDLEMGFVRSVLATKYYNLSYVHIGVYQKQASSQFFHRNGEKV